MQQLPTLALTVSLIVPGVTITLANSGRSYRLTPFTRVALDFVIDPESTPRLTCEFASRKIWP